LIQLSKKKKARLDLIPDSIILSINKHNKMENKIEYLLGLDISTSVIGMSLFKHENDILDVILSESLELNNKETKKLKGLESLLTKSKIFEEKLKQYETIIKMTYDNSITKVVIEQPLFGSNNINTVGTLMRFSGIITHVIYNTLNIICEEISSYDARMYAFPSLCAVNVYNKKGEKRNIKEIKKSLKDGTIPLFGEFPFGVAKKDVIFDMIIEKYPDINVLYDKKGEIKKINYDSSDSICCVIGYIQKIKCNSEKPKLISYEIQPDKVEYKTQWMETVYNHTIIIN